MIRLIFFAVLLSFACRMLTGHWPWDYLRSTPAHLQALRRARKLLGIRPGASHSEIIEAHKRLIFQVHPDRGGSDAQVHEANAARDLLLDSLPDESR